MFITIKSEIYAPALFEIKDCATIYDIKCELKKQINILEIHQNIRSINEVCYDEDFIEDLIKQNEDCMLLLYDISQKENLNQIDNKNNNDGGKFVGFLNFHFDELVAKEQLSHLTSRSSRPLNSFFKDNTDPIVITDTSTESSDSDKATESSAEDSYTDDDESTFKDINSGDEKHSYKKKQPSKRKRLNSFEKSKR